MPEKIQKIVFVRHAHRTKAEPRDDNGISDKGREQVKDLEKAYEKGELPPSKIFWTSPKLRCQETLKPVADKALSSIKIEKALDEQGANEDLSSFQHRITGLLEKATALNDTVYLCSHGDLIPEAIDQLTGKSVDVSKGQAVVAVNSRGKWILE